MAKIAWYGTGLMGAGFVESLRGNGDDVVVYNRTFEKAAALERFGARAVRDPREAARGADRIHIMIADDAAVDALLEALDGAIPEGAIVIDHSTVAPGPTVQRFARMTAKGAPFLHAPVFMSPQGTRERGGVMLVAGKSATFERVRGELEAMTHHLWYVGDHPEKAAALKLFGNEMLIVIVAGLADMFALAKSAGISPGDAYELFSHFKPTGAIDVRGKSMANADFTPAFELTMARKDVRLMLETAAAAGVPLHVLPAIAARMDALLAEGHGAQDMSVLGIDALPVAVTS